MKPTIVLALSLALLLTVLRPHAADLRVEAAPAWWEQRIRVVETGEGFSLYRVENGALIADRLTHLHPDERFVIPWRDDKRGVIGSDGRLLLPFEYDEIEAHDEIAAFKVKREGRWGLVGYDGAIRLPAQFDLLSDGPAATAGAPWVVRAGERRGLVDPASGQMLLPTEYAEIQVNPPFVIAVRAMRDDGQDTRTRSVFDLRGAPIPGVGPESFRGIWESAGLVLADGVRAVDSMGREVIPAGLYDSIAPVGERAIAVRNGLRGLIDGQGAPLTPFRYAEMWPLDGDTDRLFGVRETEAETGALRTGVVDAQGRTVVEPHWDRLEYLSAVHEGEEVPYYLVTRDGKTGSLNAQGRTLVPVQFDEANRIADGDPRFLLTREGLSGLCDLSRGDCPVPVVYSRLLPSDLSPDDDLYLAESDGRVGIVSERNALVVPLSFDWVRGLPGKDLESVEVEASLQFVVTRFRLERDGERRWRSTIVAGSPIGAQPYDRHPVAMERKPVVDVRYLPEGLVSDANVLAAARDGRLNEAVFPSIQIADRAAFVNFNRLVREGREPLAETMTVCREADGFRLLLAIDPEEAASAVCDETSSESLRLHGQGDELTCDECQELGLPERWVRVDAPTPQSCGSAVSRLAEWSPEAARKAYREWRYRWYGDLPILLAARQPDDGGRSPADGRLASVHENSRAHRTLTALILDPRRIVGLLGDPVDDLDWSRLVRHFSDLLGAAEPVGQGGIYPERDPRYNDTCAEVWYMRLPLLEAAHEDGLTVPGLDVYALPPAGEYRRNAYPFLTFTHTPEGIRLVGVSREFLQALLWQEAHR